VHAHDWKKANATLIRRALERKKAEKAQLKEAKAKSMREVRWLSSTRG
jgi:hypothetical protein